MRHPRNFPWVSLLCLCLLIAFGSSAVAQQGTLGALGGTIRDASGAVVTGAKVIIRNAGTNETRTTKSNDEGVYTFNQILNGTYTVIVEREGFATETFREVIVLTGQHYSLNVRLKVGATTETIEVVAGQDLVHTVSPEITATVDQRQIQELPLLGRNPIELIRNQAGVPGILSAARNNTGINGGRPGWTEITQDGINIQDNFIRNNGLDFVPNRPTSDTIGEFSIVSNNVGADGVGGTSQVKLATPSGTNAFHGTVYEYNRNNFLSANRFFNKFRQPNVPRPFLNQNQFGATIGGPILKDKLFFFGGYEGFRLRQGVTQANVIPTHDSYLNGVYNYLTGTTVNTVNVLNLVNAKRTAGLPALTISPFVQSYFLSKIRPAAVGTFFPNCGDTTSATSPVLNSECFRFNQGNTTNRDQAVARLDYNLSRKHSLQLIGQRFTDFATRSDIDNVNLTPTAFIPTKARLFTGAWRWAVTPNLLNEFRGGDNTVYAPFQTTYNVPAFAVGNGTAVTNPNITFAPQGRSVTTRQYSDNATWIKGRHNVSFGISYQGIDPHPYNFAGVFPTINFGFSSNSGNPNAGYILTSAKLPGATPSQLNAMNAYAAFLSGTITSVAQSFQVQDLNAGYVPGFPNQRAYHFSILSPYAQDRWHMFSNLTITAGLKWEYWSPIKESKTLALLPDINGNDLRGSLLNPAGTISPHEGFWNPDYNVFGPNVGFAWDPFKNGKTAVRGGYSLAYVNEDEVTAATNAIGNNFGLVAPVSLNNLAVNISAGVPVVPTPTLSTNRTYLQQFAGTNSLTPAAFAIQPNLQTPRVHELNFSIERQLPGSMAVEARYVGTLGRNLWRGVDYNQQMSGNNPAYMADFLRARNNLFNCGNANGGCAAAQPLTFLVNSNLPGVSALLAGSSAVTALKQGSAGDLADALLTLSSSANAAIARTVFLPNPNIYAADGLTSTAVSDYHALQMELRRNMKSGLAAQVNYTFSKNLADAAGNSQARFEPFLDNADHSHDYGRSEFDVTHIINSNFVYELPFGRGRRWLSSANGVIDHIIGGWSTGQIVRWQSGAPFSILSGRGTFNRSGRSGGETAFTTLTKEQIKGMLGIFHFNGNLYWINPAVLNTDGRAVGTVSGVGANNIGYDPMTYTPTFPGQVFFNPQPGQFGNMQRLDFNGPSSYTWDMSVAKTTRITERINTEFRADIFNVLNQATFFFGDTNINSTTFGQISSTGNSSRVVQLSLRVSF
jgi:hypothetical protein